MSAPSKLGFNPLTSFTSFQTTSWFWSDLNEDLFKNKKIVWIHTITQLKHSAWMQIWPWVWPQVSCGYCNLYTSTWCKYVTCVILQLYITLLCSCNTSCILISALYLVCLQEILLATYVSPHVLCVSCITPCCVLERLYCVALCFENILLNAVLVLVGFWQALQVHKPQMHKALLTLGLSTTLGNFRSPPAEPCTLSELLAVNNK